MTTQPQPTPYDAEIEKGSLVSAPDKGIGYFLARGGRDGYRRAKAEDADLLAALEQAEDKLEDIYLADNGPVSVMPDVSPTLKVIRAAIAKAKEG